LPGFQTGAKENARCRKRTCAKQGTARETTSTSRHWSASGGNCIEIQHGTVCDLAIEAAMKGIV
jgi:hypothetical protein